MSGCGKRVVIRVEFDPKAGDVGCGERMEDEERNRLLTWREG